MFTKWIKKLQNPCEEDINKLNEENKQLKQKLIEKQEQINKTNAYYKKKMYNMKKKEGHGDS